MSGLFDSARQAFLEGGIAYLTDNIRIGLVDHAIYTPVLATDQYFDDLQMTGTGDDFTNISPTITELLDAGASFASDMVGRWITISGATTPANNGTFLIASVPDATHIRYENSGPGVTEAFAGNWVIHAMVGDSGGPTRADMALLGGKSSTAGVADANDATLATVTASSVLSSLVIFQDTGSDATSLVIAQMDTGTGLPVTPNGGDITVAFDAGANKIFKL